ncbi:hypothetical protein D044_0252A, partial [Vibrio parahaemolyticus EKP-026]
MCPTGFFDHAV